MREIRCLLGTLRKEYVAQNNYLPLFLLTAGLILSQFWDMNLFCGGLECLLLSETSHFAAGRVQCRVGAGAVMEYQHLSNNDNDIYQSRVLTV